MNRPISVMPKVFEMIGSFVRGGSERQGLQLAKSLAEDGSFQVFVGCLDRSGPLLEENKWLDRSEIPEFKLNSFYDSNFIAQVYRCAAYLREHRIDVIHTHDFYTNIFGMVSGFLARVPARIASKRETFSKSERQMKIERQSFRLAHKIVCNAKAVEDFLINRGIPSRKSLIIYNGLDMKAFSQTFPPIDKISRRYGIPLEPSNRLVTIVANIRSDVKNHSMFLRSAKTVADEFGSVEFVIAGEGELENVYKEQAVSLGIRHKVHFIGACPDVPALLSISDVCVLSSRSEGFSNAILEYMAAGKPVVATRVGGAAEAVLEGETGYLVDSDDDRAMTRRITQLLRNPELAADFGKRGQQRAKEMFSLSAQLEVTKKLYSETLARAGEAS
jgi:L-malate glycosyltransferase